MKVPGLFLLFLVTAISSTAQNRDTTLFTIANYRLEPGTFSWRGDNKFYDMSSWDTKNYKEGHLKQKSGSNWLFRMNYRLLEPQGYDPNYKKGYPLLIMFHGAGERANCWDTNCYCTGCNSNGTPNPNANPRFLNNDHMLVLGGLPYQNAVNLAGTKKPDDPTLSDKAFPGFVLFPQMENLWGNENSSNSPISYALRILRLVTKQYNVDPDRIYIVGLSLGGQAVLKTLNIADWMFAAAITMSPVNYANSVRYEKVSTVPLWVFQGGLDENPKPAQTLNMLKRFREAGGSPRYTFYPEAGHNTWTRAWREPDFFSWLMQYKKSKVHLYFDNPAICATTNAGARLAMAGGFPAYQWAKDGVVIDGATSNVHVADLPGKYKGRFARVASPGQSDWNEWSDEITITEKSPIKPALGQIGTTYLKDLNGGESARLVTSDQYEYYYWYRNGEPVALPDSNLVEIRPGNCGTPCANTGMYTVSVAGFEKCPSLQSDPKNVFFNDQAQVNNAMRPTQFTGEMLTSSTCFLSWNDPSNSEIGYEIWRRNVSRPNSVWQMATLTRNDITFYLDTMLIPNSTYHYKIRALGSASRSDYFPGNNTSSESESLIIQTPNTDDQPKPPQNLRGELVAVNKIVLNWEPGWDESGIQEYLIQYNDKSVRTQGNVTTYTLTDVSVNTHYAIVVKTIDISGNESSASNQISIHSNVNGLFYKHSTGAWTSLNESSIKATWQTPEYTGVVPNFTLQPAVQEDYFNFEFDGFLNVQNAGEYTFYLNSNDGSRLFINGSQIIDFDGTHGVCTGNSESTTCPNGWGRPSSPIYLAAGPHRIRVEYFEYTGANVLFVRYNGPDTGNSTTLIPDSRLSSGAYSAPSRPSTPAGLSVNATGMTTLAISWNEGADGSAYELYRSLKSGGPFEIISRTNVNKFDDQKLRPGTTYYYRLKSVNENGSSNFSSTASGKTHVDNEPPSQPTGLRVENGNFSRTVLRWNSSTDNVGVTGYEIWANDTLLGVTPVPAYDATTPNQGEVYTYYVVAFDLRGNKSIPSLTVTNEEFATGDDEILPPPLSVEKPEDQLHFYPNPNDGEFMLVWAHQQKGSFTIEIINSVGQRTYVQSIAERAYDVIENGIRISTALADGLYILKLTQGNTTISKRLLIQRKN